MRSVLPEREPARFIGFPDLVSDTAPFPKTASFVHRCEQLLTREMELYFLRVVVCLGVPAAKLLAAITPRVASWRPWPGYVKPWEQVGAVLS